VGNIESRRGGGTFWCSWTKIGTFSWDESVEHRCIPVTTSLYFIIYYSQQCLFVFDFVLISKIREHPLLHSSITTAYKPDLFFFKAFFFENLFLMLLFNIRGLNLRLSKHTLASFIFCT
jgi:hypothetical protein